MSAKDLEKGELKCVELIGELAHLGKHICFAYGFTLCGCPTVDYDRKMFPLLQESALKDFPSEYRVVKWDITCKRCLDMAEILKSHNDYEKEKRKNWN